MKKRIILLLLAAAALTTAAARPRLIVQIVVGSMRAGDLERYAANFGDGGLKRLTEGGTCYADARYDCMQTTTPVSLATLATGAMPSMHGVIGPTWRDYTSNETVFLTEGKRGPGAYHLIAPTLAETLRAQYSESRTVTVAAEAESAILLAGKGGNVFWLETGRCNWATSPYYAEELPDWIGRSNREHYNLSFLAEEWRTLLDRARYRNTRHWDITLAARNRREKDEAGKGRLHPADDLERLRCTPAGNSALLAFAKQAIAQYRLGTDEVPDLLTVCLDPARRIMETYGPESVEVEDMYYRLDRDLADFLTYLFAQVRDGDAIVVLTSDHGSSPSFDAGPAPAERFNARQFEVIVNGFLNVRYGMGNWVLGYEERSLWLNHNLIYERGLDLSEVQNEVATFAMQFDGVSHALSSTAMRTSYFGSGYARLMQNGFYPRRSGDVVLNLMPGWIEERDGVVSASGSMYGYDTHVPLIFYGKGIAAQRVRRQVGMTAVAPTLARLAGIDAPTASDGEVLPEAAE